MSASLITVIPTDPRWVPTEDQERRAAALIEDYLRDSDEFTVERPSGVTLYDSRENFESIHCPFCAAVLDVQPWWTDQLDAAYHPDTGFSSLDTATPCCNKSVSLNDLTYHFPMGFASWAVTVRNTPCDLSDDAIHQIEGALGHAVRVVYTHI